MTSSTEGASICSKLSAVLPGKVFLPGSSKYKSSLESYFFRTARESPACIVKPENTEEVEAIVRVLAANPDIKFAIRSGGHTPNPQRSNVDGGVTIDLRSLKCIEKVEGHDDLLAVGPGAQWSDVYDLLENTGRTVVGSREPSVGVGGFITGGKWSTGTYDVHLIRGRWSLFLRS